MNINTCPRCKKSHDRPTKRCEICAEYARTWQKNRTKTARENNRCITCMNPAKKSRCEFHTKSKSESYQKSKNNSIYD